MRKALYMLVIMLPLTVTSQEKIINDTLRKGLEIKLHKIDTNNVDNANVNDIKLDELEVRINETDYFLATGKAKFYDKLAEVNYNLIKIKINEYRRAINYQNSSLDRIYYKKGSGFLVKNDIQSAKKYFDKSLEINPLYIPSLYKLSSLYLEEGNLRKASGEVTILLNKTYPDAVNYHLIQKLANDIYNGFIKKADELKGKENFTKAEELLTYALKFCKENKSLMCIETVEKKISETKYGIYKSYLGIAQSAINSKHQDIAESFVFSAMQFRRQNIFYLKSNKEAENLLEQMIDLWLVKADLQINKDEYINAMNCFEKASILCDSAGTQDCNAKIKRGIKNIKTDIYNQFIVKALDYMDKGQSLKAEDYLNKAKYYKKLNQEDIKDTSVGDYVLRKIKNIQYKKLIKEGKEYAEYFNYEQAMKSLDNADEMEKKYKLDNIPEKDSLMKKAAKPIILKKIKSCDIKIWGNDLAGTENILKNAEMLRTKHFLDNDPEVKESIRVLKQKILKRECENYQQQYDLLLFRAEDFIKKLDYIDGERTFDEAVKLVYKQPLCNLYVLKAYTDKDKYLPPANYQKMIEDANYYFFKNNYSKCVDIYSTAESYYSIYKIAGFGLKYIPVYDYVTGKDNINMVIAAISFYNDIKLPYEALRFLKYLKEKNYPAEKTKLLQEKTAILMVKADVDLHKNESKHDLITGYTKYADWFRYFNVKYKKEMKRIRN